MGALKRRVYKESGPYSELRAAVRSYGLLRSDVRRTKNRLKALFRQYGVPLLYNAHRVIRTERGPFAVAGIDDMRFGNHDLDATLRGLDPAIPTILLSHRPEIFPEAVVYQLAKITRYQVRVIDWQVSQPLYPYVQAALGHMRGQRERTTSI